MTTELQLAYGIVKGRAYSDQDRALLRTLELARKQARRERRAARPTTR